MPDRKPPPRPDPRRDGNPAPPPRRSSLTGIVAGQTSPARREVPPPLPTAHRPQPRPTMTGAPAPPAPQSAPEPPVLRTRRGLGPALPELPALEPPSVPPPRSLSPPPMASPAEEQAIAEAARRYGDRVVRAPESTPLPSSSPPPAKHESFLTKAGQSKALVIAAWGTAIAGIIAALSKGAVDVIAAWRTVDQVGYAAAVERIEKLEKARSEDNGGRLESRARRAKDDELAAEDMKLDARLKKLEGEPRVQTVQGLPSN